MIKNQISIVYRRGIYKYVYKKKSVPIENII